MRYEAALKEAPDLTEVRLEVTLEIGPDGTVADVAAPSTKAPELAKCVRGVVKAWEFPGSIKQSISFPLIFRGR